MSFKEKTETTYSENDTQVGGRQTIRDILGGVILLMKVIELDYVDQE